MQLDEVEYWQEPDEGCVLARLDLFDIVTMGRTPKEAVLAMKDAIHLYVKHSRTADLLERLVRHDSVQA